MIGMPGQEESKPVDGRPDESELGIRHFVVDRVADIDRVEDDSDKAEKPTIAHPPYTSPSNINHNAVRPLNGVLAVVK